MPSSKNKAVRWLDCHIDFRRKLFLSRRKEITCVSFKAPAGIDPSIAATSVMAHEKEHIALAEGRAAESGGQVISSVTLETSVCDECGRVYVSGGKAHITTITPAEKQETGTTYQGEMALDDSGADLFRKIYKQTMVGKFGLFFDATA